MKIKATNRSACVEITKIDGRANMLVTVTDSSLSAKAEVYGFDGEDIRRLGEFLADLNINWRGWPGEKRWGSTEGEISLIATCDKLGHVYFKVQLSSDPYPVVGWKVETTLLCESGQLESIYNSFKIELST